MKIVDANVVLRYLLNDHADLSEQATMIIENCEVLLLHEVIAEIVYVLDKVYCVQNHEISVVLSDLLELDNILLENGEVLKTALRLFGEKRLDFVDALLFAYSRVKGYEVFTFDKKLNALL